jgi:DNA-binding MarR family transcriptional regulator
VSLTAEGRKTLGKLRAIVKRLEEEFLAPLDDEQRAQLHSLLLQLARYHDPRCAASQPRR